MNRKKYALCTWQGEQDIDNISHISVYLISTEWTMTDSLSVVECFSL